MRYIQPLGAAENAPYINGDESTGTEGSPIPAEAIEAPQRELISLILAGDVVPDSEKVDNVLTAVNNIIDSRTLGSFSFDRFFHAQDQKAFNVDGGFAANNGVVTRDLNTVLSNTLGLSLSSNQILVPEAGEYFIDAKAVSSDLRNTKLFIRNVTDAASVMPGLNDFGDSASVATAAATSGVISVTTPNTLLELRQYTQVSVNINDLGIQSPDPSFPSIYSDIKIWRIS